MKHNLLLLSLIAIVGSIFFLFHSFIPAFEYSFNSFAVTTEQLFAWFASGIGLFTIILYYLLHSKHRQMGISIGCVILLIGLVILFKPTFGDTVVAVVLAIILLLSGIVKITNLGHLDGKIKKFTLVSAIISILVSLVCLVYFITSSEITLFLFLALDILFDGIIMLIISIEHPYKEK